MNTLTLRGAALAMRQGALMLVAVLTMHADATFTFQNGANGYSAARDISINTQYAQYNGGNGIQWRGDAQLGCYTTTGNGAYSVRYLLKFGGLSLPAGARAVSATLTISLDSWNAGPGNITGFYLKNAWNGDSNRLGWLYRDDTQSWAGPGASSAGVDSIAGRSFRVPALRPIGAQTLTIPLDLSAVQSWIDSPAANQGIMLVNNNPGEIVRIVSTAGLLSMRPKLTIVTTAGSGIQVGISPANVTLQPGRQQTFSATVTGTPNTAVTWTATGGTISSTGVYTAGAASGNFTATATSVADPSKSATATVSIQPITISISPTTATLQPGQTRQFAATVTGSSNTAVTWTATGGTVSTTGLFTAGSTAGSSFAVTATSVADPTKSASAAVIVQPAPTVSITISPATATLQPGQTRQFAATVAGSSNTAVTWTATGGTISTTGLFTAGSTAGSSFTVTATSVADTTKSAFAAVTVQSAPTVSVTISPASATLQPGQTRQFAATVAGSSNTAVTWTATGGTISTTGLYTAGSTAGISFSVTATSVADPTKSASVQITVQAAPTVQISLSPANITLQSAQSQQFTAKVTGTSNTAVTWAATGGSITAAGLYTAGQGTGNFTVTARSVADTSKTATAAVRIETGQAPPPVPRQSDGAYVVIQSPVSGMRFTAPATVRIYADPFDSGAADPDAHTVRFLMNGQSVGTYTGSGAQNGYYAVTVNSLAAGTYAITAQITTTRNGTVTSAPVTIYVDNPPASSGQVFNLTSDVVLSGSQVATYAGTPGNRCAINGNGFQIRSALGFTGSLNINNCEIRGLGTATRPGINVTVNGSGSIQLTGNVLDTFGTVSIATNDQAQAVVRGNEFRENTLVPVGSQPADTSTLTLPVFYASGNSSAQKFFQGNNVGLSTVMFQGTRNWLIGGSTDAESNVLMGVRCGFTINGSTNMVLRGNYSQHNYPHRMSQGENFQLVGDGFLVEHNVIRSSSWPVRGIGGELRYNLIDASGNSDQVLQAPRSNTRIHHNVFTFTVSQTLYSPGAGLSLLYNVDNIQFHNNVMDGGGTFMGFYGSPVSITSGSFISSLRNNVFYNFAGLSGSPILAGALGESTNPPLPRLRYSDYNDFYNPNAPNQVNYGLGVVGASPGSAGYGLHDLGGLNGHADPKFQQPTAIPFPFLPQDIWTRTKKVSDVLATYRVMYSPATGSPLIGAGDPQDGSGNIGAVGKGEAADKFGRFGGTSPGAPGISSFTASPATVQAGQSVTLNWSVTGADSLSIAPSPGSVTGNSIIVTPTATTTYTLTAANSGGSVTATATVTVIATPVVSVIVAPSSVSLATSGTQQFTATVTNASNTAVTWTATGGTITATGLYTAATTAGSFTVTARSVQDPTKSASATITITAPQPVGVTISPATATLLPSGTQQFTATVTNASNTAVTWTATGGTITPAGLYTAATTAGSFTVTARSVQDPTKSASATMTITAPQPVGVTISPATATLLPSGTQQFTATLTNASNTAVTWTATGGTITPAGLYTAATTAGSFTVTARSVQDATKSASATVTITAPQQVTVTISPTSTTLFSNGAQQFSATVTNAANTAVTWAVTGGTITATGLYTAGSTTGSFTVTARSVQDSTKTASAAITITPPSPSTGHPRIILDTPTLTTLRGRMQSGTQEWTRLKTSCDSYIGGTAQFINGNDYINRPNVGEGYQGSGYIEALMPLGLCYQTIAASDPTTAAKYAAVATSILMAMSDPANQIANDCNCPVPRRDYGYGIRNFGVAMGIGYDWFHAVLTPAQKTQLQNALSSWINSFENDSFEYDHPQGNYFAGYYAAKCMAALAVEGDSPLGATWWNDWYSHQHLQRVAPYYTANLAGGGWTEGFTQYGILGSKNQALPALAVRTAKGIDLIHAPQPYTFPLDQGRYLMAFTWPTRNMMDDRGELYGTGSTTIWPGTPNIEVYRFFAGFLAMWGDPSAPMLHKYTRDVKTALDAIQAGGGSAAWVDFLFWDDTAPEADYTTLTPSYLASGVAAVAARSDWSTGASYMTFFAGPYINFPGAGHEPFDKGSPAFERNKNPLLVNPAAWLAHEPYGDPGWTLSFDDRFGNWDVDRTKGNRILNNTFQVRHLNSAGTSLSNYGQWAMTRDDGARTSIGRYEDGGSYVLAVGQFLEDMYRPLQSICPGRPPITTWSRQIVFLRPSQFIIYDRTGICDASLDQYLAFHFPADPVEGAAPALGLRRFDVNTGQFAGSMTTVLPANAATVTTDRHSTDSRTWNKLWRTEIRPTDAPATARRWLTVFDLAPSPSQVAATAPVNVVSGPAVGVQLTSPAGNSVAIAGTAPVGTAIAGPLNYVVPATPARHVITDLAPSAGYTISAGVLGGNLSISITQGGTGASSANGVLTFQVTAGGQITQ